MRMREHVTGYIFIFPAAFLIFLFGLFPILYSAYMSLHRWRLTGDHTYRGLQNYSDILGDWTGLAIFIAGFLVIYGALWLWNKAFRADGSVSLLLRLAVSVFVAGLGVTCILYGWERMFKTGDTDFFDSLIITVYYAFGSIPLQLTLGLLLAYTLYQNIWGKQTFRMIFFLPYVTPAVAAATVFTTVFSPRENSMMNQVIGLFGAEPQKWLQESRPFLNVVFGWDLSGFLAGPSMALVCIIILGIWTYTGYNAVIFLAGLGSIPGELYEAAKVDGANQWHLFRYITLPLLSPVTFYLSILGFIGTFKAFNSIYVMRDPLALGTTDTISIVIFDRFYKANQAGYAAAEAIVLFFIILAITQFQRSVLESRVFYE